MRKTKIVCTLGPASEKEEVLAQMIQAGMNVARINFSHGSHEEHQKKLDLLFRLREEMKVPVAALLDTKGPEVRLGTFANGRETLAAGDTFTLTTVPMEGTKEKASITFAGLPGDVKAGDAILIDDGLIEMTVEDDKVVAEENIDGREVECKAIQDSYIHAGSYSKANYGKETILLAEESGLHRDHDDRTKRAYIGFDISKIKDLSKFLQKRRYF